MSPRTAGRALVILSNGYSYEATVSFLHGLAHCSEVTRTIGSGEDAVRVPAAGRVWPAGQLREVRWLADEVAA